MAILVTGSSGFVAENLLPKIKMDGLITIDKTPGESTMHVIDLNDSKSISKIIKNINEPYTLIHLAAARSDFGITPEEYYRNNVEATENLLISLQQNKPRNVIHVSSVASIDGATIAFQSNLKSDDAYRATKFIQETLVIDWAKRHDVGCHVLLPSAIFDASARLDTNIGRLIRAVRALRVFPCIDTKKSITLLDNFTDFILMALFLRIPSGKYLTIESPVLSINEMVLSLNPNITLLKIPFLKMGLLVVALFLENVGLLFKFEPKLTRNRVYKLYKSTDYSRFGLCDNFSYENTFSRSTASILKNL